MTGARVRRDKLRDFKPVDRERESGTPAIFSIARTQGYPRPDACGPALLRSGRTVVAGVPLAEFLKLSGDQVEHAIAVALGRVAAVAVAPAQLHQITGQISTPLALSLLSASHPPFCRLPRSIGTLSLVR